MKNETLLKDFKQHLKAQGKTPLTIGAMMSCVRRFLRHVGDQRLDRLSGDVTRSFFDDFKGQTRQQYAWAVSQFLQFAARGLPAVVGARGSERIPAPVVKDPKEMALRQAWAIEQQTQQQEAEEAVIARLARQLINHFLYFEKRIKGAPENLDDLYRFRAECQELIKADLSLFMELSAKGL